MRVGKFFKKFELFADAPNAVAKMRELVLQLAVRGHLTPQNPQDEPASKAIKKIVSLNVSGRTAKFFADEESIQVPFAVPASWKWVRFGDLVRIRTGKLDANAAVDSGAYPFFTCSKTPSTIASYSFDTSAVILAGNGDFNLKSYSGKFDAYQRTYVIEPLGWELGFCFWLINAQIKRITDNQRGSAIPYLRLGDISDPEVPFPPLAEQKRIVAKVDELMALCDRLEAQQQERDTRHAALARASLARFAEAPTPVNLDLLFHNSYTITPADLRKSILTLAVQGRLIAQDPNDEPAADTFRKLSSVTVEADDDEFPEHWLRVPLGKLGEWRGGGTPSKSRPDFWKGDIPWVSPKDMKVLRIANAQDHISGAAVEGSSVRMIPVGSLLMVVRGMILARSFPVAVTAREVTINQDMKALLPFERDTTEFILLALRAFEPKVLAAIERSTHGTCKLETETLQAFTIPLPPLAEQRRIVAKVDQLMAWVDQLEAQLIAAKAKSAALLEAVIYELLNPTAEIIDFPQAKRDPLADRASIGCYVVEKMAGKRYFGRTAAMKLLYLAETHLGLNLDGKPLREAAGPFDRWIYRFEEEGAQQKWFKTVEGSTSEGHTKIEYRPGPALKAKAALAESALTSAQHKEFDRLLTLFADRTTEEAEIIATLFAAWNDFLIDGLTPSDDEIICEVRENWHAKKKRFTSTQLQQWLGWLRQNALIPKGRLPRTAHQARHLLD